MILEMFSRLLTHLLHKFQQDLTPVLRDLEIKDPETFEPVTPALAELVREYRRQAAEVANRFMEEAAAEVGGQAFIPPVEGYPDHAVSKVLQDSRSINEVTSSLERHVRMAARRQVVRAVPAPVVPPASGANPGSGDVVETVGGLLEGAPARDSDSQDNAQEGSKPMVYPVAWARVLTGSDNCAFCIMLASRGPVYSSAHHGGRSSKGRWGGESRQWSNSYHNHCDCLVVPVYDPKRWAGKEQADALYKVYEQVTRSEVASGKSIGEGNDKLKAWSEYLKKLSKEGQELQYPTLAELTTPAGPEAGSSKLSAPGITELRSFIPPSEKLEPHELDFLKRFEAQGYTAEWIPRRELRGKPGQFAPSNDFYWVEKGFQATELKTSKNKYSTISTRIKDAVSKAKNHESPVMKEHFVIDIGTHQLSDKLRYQLSEYNVRKPEATIVSLWVMHSGGQVFEEIKLQ